jgi:hypothetical protein
MTDGNGCDSPLAAPMVRQSGCLENERVRAAIDLRAERSRVTLSDGTGSTRAFIAVDNDGSIVGLRDPDGNLAAALGALSDGPQLILAETNGKARTELSESKLRIVDDSGAQATVGAIEVATSGKGEGSQKTSAASVVLSDTSGKVLWKAP